MGSHFRAAGWLRDEEGLEKLAEILTQAMEKDLVQLLETPRAETAYHVVIDSRTRSELWYCMTDGEIQGVSPHFHGTEQVSVMVDGYQTWEEEGEATLFTSLPDNSAFPDLPLTFELANYLNQSNLKKGELILAQVGGLGYNAKTYQNQEDIPRDKFAPQFLIPTGAFFEPRSHKPDARKCDIQCRGAIRELERLANSWTELPVWRVKLDTGALVLDVLIDPGSVHGDIERGVFLEGEFWLTGKTF